MLLHGRQRVRQLGVVAAPTVDDEIRADVVRLLRDALAEAETGRVVGLLMATKEIDGGWTHRATATFELREHIGALELLKFERMAATE